jgi:hypothetical protein
MENHFEILTVAAFHSGWSNMSDIVHYPWSAKFDIDYIWVLFPYTCDGSSFTESYFTLFLAYFLHLKN